MSVYAGRVPAMHRISLYNFCNDWWDEESVTLSEIQEFVDKALLAGATLDSKPVFRASQWTSNSAGEITKVEKWTLELEVAECETA